MSSITPAEPTSLTYSKSDLSELEDELKKDAKHRQEASNDEIGRLQSSHAEDLRNVEEEYEETVDTIRENQAETREADRAKSREDIRELRSQLYDEKGRNVGESADRLKEQLLVTEKALKQAEGKSEERHEHLVRATDKRVQNAVRDYNREMKKEVRAARDSANRLYDEVYENMDEDYDSAAALRESYRKLEQERARDNSFDRLQARQQLEDSELDFRMRQLEKNQDHARKTETLAESFRDKNLQHLEASKQSTDRQIGTLRKQVNDLLRNKDRYVEGYADGKIKAVREHDDDHRAKMEAVGIAYEQQIRGLKERDTDKDANFTRLQDQIIKEKDAQSNEKIHRMNAEHQTSLTDLQETFIRDRKINQDKQKVLDEASSRRIASVNENAKSEREEVLAEQAQAFQRTLASQSQSAKDKERVYEKELSDIRTTDDVSKISPAAEAKVRDNVVKQYEKLLTEEQMRNERSTDSLTHNYKGRLQDVVSEGKSREAQLRQQSMAEISEARGKLVHTVSEIEQSTREKIKDQEITHMREKDSMNRSFGNALAAQRRQYEELLNQTKVESEERIRVQRDESSFRERMNKREFAARQNDLVRKYEIEMTRQKEDLEAEIEEIQSKNNTHVRQLEKNHRHEVDRQKATFNHRTQQLMKEFEERERTIRANYEEELEGVRRANARLIRKNS